MPQDIIKSPLIKGKFLRHCPKQMAHQAVRFHEELSFSAKTLFYQSGLRVGRFFWYAYSLVVDPEGHPRDNDDHEAGHVDGHDEERQLTREGQLNSQAAVGAWKQKRVLLQIKIKKAHT